jgi:aryl-alcohol dehydrogenase-like predicted oxidoreductase
VGLGCSSFSTFFWSDKEMQDCLGKSEINNWTPDSLDKSHPRVQEWIQTILYAVTKVGITLLDTAPWYGHGTSEIVIGWAMQEILFNGNLKRDHLIINTKVGRYEADPEKQFDFSKTATIASVQRSLERLQCGGYIDVLQLHDPEFAPSLDQILNETIPAMVECRENGWCRALGMTGYPLEVQHQILQRSLEVHGPDVWDQALTYGHFNLHDMSLTVQPVAKSASFATYCWEQKIALLCAAPLSMGLLTERGPPEWHPASAELKQASRRATNMCKSQGVNISTLALCVALSDPRIPCTILGMKDASEVDAVVAVAERFRNVDNSLPSASILKQVLTEDESQAWNIIRDPLGGPFASVWSSGTSKWDGVREVRLFYNGMANQRAEEWHAVL